MLNLRHPDSIQGRSLLQRKVQFNNLLHQVKVPERLTKTVGFNTQAIIVDAVNTAAAAAHWAKVYSDKLTLLFRQIILGAFVVSLSVSPTLALEDEQINLPKANQSVKTPLIKESLTTRQAPIFQKPLKNGYLSQRFWSVHPAIDIPNPLGTAVRPVAEGKVVSAGWDGGFGLTVVIKHKDGFSSRYAHLSKVLVLRGQKVNKKTIIGAVGATGVATGYHLHLELDDDGRLVDPLKYIPGF